MEEDLSKKSLLETAQYDVSRVITTRVVENSFKDSISLSATSKTLNMGLLGEDRTLYLKSAIIYPLTHLPELVLKHEEIMKDCWRAQNQVAAFWVGMYVFLKYDNWKEANKYLSDVAKWWHFLELIVGLLFLIHGEQNPDSDRFLRELRDEYPLVYFHSALEWLFNGPEIMSSLSTSLRKSRRSCCGAA